MDTTKIMESHKIVAIAAASGVTAGVALIGAPVVLGVIGFTKVGVAAGSIAAAVQGPTTAAGSLFALCQSAGVLGTAVGTKAIIGGAAGTLGGAVAAIWK
ncbi:interferon alpha-inducible protein 27-like protein 2A [Saccostrea echinata]|uniref:interferon alpha-inducible protein 27-like protein 2A n=1 Tax=Saccostrea echinata TaxID=191078 RepID=UPI002A8070E0|nr:interferon alpha-inducible protein 27-like protein 2A [Saccostrea echinata]